SRWYDPAVETHQRRSWFARQLQKMNDSLERVQNLLARTLGWSLHHRWLIVALGVGAIVFSLALMQDIGSDFMPDFDREELQVSFETPSGTTLAETTAVAQRLTELL